MTRRAYAPHAVTIGTEPMPMTADYGRFIDEDEVWVGEGGADGIAVCLVLQIRPDHLLLWSLAVSPDLQSGGIGRQLLAFAEDRARRHGLRRVRLFTNEKMTANRAWYARCGYREAGLEDLGGRQIVHMEKELAGYIDPATGLPYGSPVAATAARRPSQVALDGRLVSVVPLDPETHGPSLYDATHGPEKERLFLYLPNPPFPDRDAFLAFLRKAAQSEDPVFYAIVDRATGMAIGHATYMRIEPQQRVIEVGNILFSPALARTAAATEAMYLMARHAFETLGYRRYEWKCNALHAGSRRAALRLGFDYEGTFRNHMIVKGRNRDTAWFSMLEADWPRIRAEFERWLAPDNFDAEGRQKSRLSM